jgi:hypothetical protein
MADESEFDVFLSHRSKDKVSHSHQARSQSGALRFRDLAKQNRHSICLRPHNTSIKAYSTRRFTR